MLQEVNNTPVFKNGHILRLELRDGQRMGTWEKRAEVLAGGMLKKQKQVS